MQATGTQAEGLIPAHGGKLVSLLLDGPAWEKASQEAKKAPQIKLTDRQVNDVDLLTIGGLSPLEGFMGSADYRAVVAETRLASGTVWPIPVVLGITDEQKAAIGKAETIALCGPAGPLALLRVAEIFEPTLEAEAKNVYGTTETKHPGVEAIHQRGKWLVAGKIEARQVDFDHSVAVGVHAGGFAIVHGVGHADLDQ